LEESGEKARLEEYLRQKLIECGWKDELKKYCLGKVHLLIITILSKKQCRFDKKQGVGED